MESLRCSGSIPLAKMPARFVPVETLSRCHGWHKIKPVHGRQRRRPRLQRRDIKHAVAIRYNDRVRHAVIADMGRQSAGIDATNTGNAACLQPPIEMPCRTPIGGGRDVRVNNNTAHTGGRRHIDRLDVFLVRADIPDMREGEGHNLPGIGRVGQNFLVARHGRVETDFALRFRRSTDGLSLDHGPVRQHQKCGRFRFDPALFSAHPA